MTEIKAKRGTWERTFSEREWNLLPADKCGWVPAAEIPAAVQHELKKRGHASPKHTETKDNA